MAKKKAKKAKKKAKRSRFAVPAHLYDGKEDPSRRNAARRLVNVYNALCSRVAAPERALLLTEHVQDLFCAVVAFAESKKIHPPLWVYSLFVQHGWKRVPPWRDFFLPARVVHVEKLNSVDRAAVVSMWGGTMAAIVVDPLSAVTPGAEAAKAQFHARGRFEVCMLSSDVTYGYVSASKWCVICPVADACRTRKETFMRTLRSST